MRIILFAGLLAGAALPAFAQSPALPPITAVPDTALIGLAKQYLQAGDTATASAAIRKSVDAPGLSERERATRLAAAIGVVMNHGTPEGLAAAERLARRLDRLSRAVTPQKIAGHNHLLSDYRALDNDERIFAHASRILALVPALKSDARKGSADAITSAYASLARVYGDRAQAVHAIAILDTGIRAAADLPSVVTELHSVRARYEHIGRLGPAIEGQYWFNAPAGTTKFAPSGVVKMIEFTAHWCGPCRKSYPAVARLQRKYGRRGLRTMLVTATYGFFKDQKALAPAQEALADSTYYLAEHALPAEVVVYDTHAAAHGSDTTAKMLNETNYNVGGIPQIVLLDRNDVVRMIVVGWDPASERYLSRMLETIFSDPVP